MTDGKGVIEDEQSTLWLSWRDDQFIAQVGFLSTMNALAYFSKSPFFQGIPDQQSMLSSHKTKRLMTRGGDVGYILQDAQPPHLFVVRREQKTRAGDMPTAAYYIIDGTVYQSPSLYSVFHSRLRRCSFKISETLEMLRQDLNPIDGTLSKRRKDMYQTLKRLEALQKNEFTSNTETFARSDHIIASVLHQQAAPLFSRKKDT